MRNVDDLGEHELFEKARGTYLACRECDWFRSLEIYMLDYYDADAGELPLECESCGCERIRITNHLPILPDFIGDTR